MKSIKPMPKAPRILKKNKIKKRVINPQNDIPLAVANFYEKYGKMMRKLSYE